MSRKAITALTVAVATVMFLVVGVSAAIADICPTLNIQAGCYHPSVSVTASPSSVDPGGSSNITVTITGADPAIGCQKTDDWSGWVWIGGGGDNQFTETVGPFSEPGSSHKYGVTCQAYPDTGSGSVIITVKNSPSPQPPPPPPPLHLPADYTCCDANTGGGMQPMAVSEAAKVLDLPASFVAEAATQGTATTQNNRCWSNANTEPPGWGHKKGTLGYYREVRQFITFCAVYGRYIVSAMVGAWTNYGAFCTRESGPKTWQMAGGIGRSSIKFHTEAGFKCDMPPPLNIIPGSLHDKRYTDNRYDAYGNGYQEAAG